MATVQKWGNSLAVRIPASMAEQLKFEAGTPVQITADENAIIVTRKSRLKYRLSDLLKDCKPSQLHGETDFGPDVGREELD
jgi:antitoxin MazE